MNLRHGQLWQRLGLTVLSGILVASLAPATAAAPVTGQEISDDAGSFSGDVSSVGTGDVVSDVAQGSDVSDGVDASAGDSASEAAASNEGERGDVRTYTYPGTSGPTRIHVISTQGSDAILLESKGLFGMIDGGEGLGAPDGSDPRYPVRPGTAPASYR